MESTSILVRNAVATNLRTIGEPRRHQQADLDLIIPALNEESRIGRTLGGICAHLANSPLKCRIIVVDNGSADATAEVVDMATASHVRTDVIGCGRRGKGAAVKAGMQYATAPAVGYCDADQSTPPSAISAGYELLQHGWDLVIGSRRCAGASYTARQSLTRRVGSKAFNVASSRLVGPILDTQCGFKLFRLDVAQTLFEEMRLQGFAFDVELLARARRRNLAVAELAIAWSDETGSTFRPLTDGLAAFRDLYHVHRALRAVDAA